MRPNNSSHSNLNSSSWSLSSFVAPKWMKLTFKNMTEIASGGFSTVYKADRYAAIGPSKVAIKVITVKTPRFSMQKTKHLRHMRSQANNSNANVESNSRGRSPTDSPLSMMNPYPEATNGAAAGLPIPGNEVSKLDLQLPPIEPGHGGANLEELEDSELDKPLYKEDIKRELAIWRHMTKAKVPYLVQLLDELDFGNEVWAVMELSSTTLLDFLISLELDEITLSSEALRDLMAPIILALEAMHELGFVHFDIKPQNILLTHPLLTIKLSDFGSAREIDKLALGGDDLYGEGIYTPLYSPPEIKMHEMPLTQTFDTWSFLVTLHSLFICGFPWKDVPGIGGLSDEDALREFKRTLRLVKKGSLHPDRAQRHVYTMMGIMLYDNDRDPEDMLYACGLREPNKDPIDESEAEDYTFNPRLDQVHCEFIMNNLYLDPKLRPTMTDLAKDPIIKNVVDHYRFHGRLSRAQKERNFNRLHQLIYGRSPGKEVDKK